MPRTVRATRLCLRQAEDRPIVIYDIVFAMINTVELVGALSI